MAELPTSHKGTSPSPQFIEGLAGLLDQIGRILAGNAVEQGLHPVQWSALRYFAVAGAHARTMSGLAKFQGTTPGPTSRTIGALKRKGYLTATSNPDDRRSSRLDVTASGKRMLRNDPIKRLEELLITLPENELQTLADLLEKILPSIRNRHSPNSG